LKAWALLITGAVLPFLFPATLPSNVALVLLLLTTLAATRTSLRLFCLLPGFFLITTLSINDRLATRLTVSENKLIYTVSGVIGNLPESRGDVVRFLFLPDRVTPFIPPRIRVHWYRERGRAGDEDPPLPVLHAGERWQLKLELRSPRGRVNFSGVDAERWHFADGIGALGYVQDDGNIRLDGPDNFDLNYWRESVQQKLVTTAGHVPAFRMLTALAIADRRALTVKDRTVLSATGTGHLLAISGLHIGLAAAMGFYLGRFGLLFLIIGAGQRFAIILPWLGAWLAALAYAGLAGFGVSTQRALIMLSVATLVMLGRRNVHPALAWMIAMAVVLVLDPFAPLRAGFWFSFVAVAVLMMIFIPWQGALPMWRRMLLAQLGISLVMAPLGMYWFQQASLPGLLANLVAIPLVSMVIVPLVLLALLFLWMPGPLAEWLLTMAGYSAHWLFLLLQQLSEIQPTVFSATRSPGLASTILAMLGAVVLLLPRAVPARFAGILLMIPMLLPASPMTESNELRMDFLDVGQGLAVLVDSRDYLLVYDTGPGDGVAGEDGWDLIAGTIRPMILATGKLPDLIVASHADLDHAGGLARLRAFYPQSRYLASLPERRAAIDRCNAPARWTAGNLKFRVVHPSIGLPYLGNDSSCVISIHGRNFGILLSGDISRVVEQRLVDLGLSQHTILTAPHHGSSTSSSKTLIDAVKPSLVLISAATNNRFGFPRADVLQRYANAAIPALNTASCGGIRVTSDGNGGFRVESARIRRQAIWRWPAGAECP